VFCRIVKGEIPSTKVLETDEVLAIRDIAPQAPVHVLVMPKQHFANLMELKDARMQEAVWAAVQAVASKEGLQEFRTIVNTGASAGQTVFHLHIHVVGGRQLGPLC
jgi:histidine triad (HIT) family protein